MQSIIRSRPRIFSLISKINNRRLAYSSYSHEAHREPIISSSSMLRDPPPADHTPPPHPPPPPPPPEVADKKSRGFLKFGLFAAITGGVATAVYASYGSFSG